jgi:coproporphyrinogen III oxidase
MTVTANQNTNATLEKRKEAASAWFGGLRNEICTALEKIEEDASGVIHGNLQSGRFERKAWDRKNEDGSPGGGGEMSVIRGGRVFEKAGVNISTVHGHFSEQFRKEIPGAAENGGAFWASGVSLVIHPRSPLVPIVHMNTRMIATSKSWFGGGADLTPVVPVEKDTADFHAAFRTTCDRHGSDYYARFKKWCDEYFFIKHRNEPRGVGGVFYDYLDSGSWDADFAFTQEIGRAFQSIYPEIVRRHMNEPWTDEQTQAQLVKRGRYVEFNLIYDRGTRFGLMTGGNTEAILMSLPPGARWP